MREFMKKDLSLIYAYDRTTKNVQAHIANWKVKEARESTWRIKRVVGDFLYFDQYPQLREWLTPYCEAKFKTGWKVLVPGVEQLISQICKGARALCDTTEKIAVDGSVIASLTTFLERYRESAFVVLSLMTVARFPQFWRAMNFGKYPDEYPGLNMLNLPAIVGTEPLEIFVLVKKINDYLAKQDTNRDFLT